MKLNKFFMLGLAGLAFAACSNEEEVGNQLPEGNGAVTVKLVSPAMTKAVVEGTGDVSSVKVTGEVVITLQDNGGENQAATVTVGENGELSTPTVTFWNVTSPGKITAVMHSGISDYSNIAITGDTPELQTLPASIPVYGEATPTPMNISKPGVDGEDDTNFGAQAGDQNKNFDMYEATVSLQIPVARLEVSGLTHVEHTSSATCKFTNLKICGVYLDHVRPGDGGEPENYKFPGDANGGPELEEDALLYDAINGGLSGGDPFTSTVSWPTDANKTTPVFAYNFYAPAANDATITSVDKNVSIAQNPHFKVVFSYTDNSTAVSTTKYRYAMITAYKEGDNYIVMRKGRIYKITGAQISDDAIIPDEEGNTTYGVEVTVKEAVWEVHTITGEWVEQ